jgi:hypothetical protein
MIQWFNPTPIFPRPFLFLHMMHTESQMMERGGILFSDRQKFLAGSESPKKHFGSESGQLRIRNTFKNLLSTPLKGQ